MSTKDKGMKTQDFTALQNMKKQLTVLEYPLSLFEY